MDSGGRRAKRPRPLPATRVTGSLGRRMIVIAALWILILLAGGGWALDRVLTSAVTRNFDDQLDYVLTSLFTSAEIGPDGEVIFNREPADQRFLEPYSGLYWQVVGAGQGSVSRRGRCGTGRSRMAATTPTSKSMSTTARSSRASRRSACSNAT